MYYYVTFVGYTTLVYISIKFFCLVWYLLQTYFLPSLGFVKDLRKYGEWVVVTGATDGIGKQYARQLAKQGFKVVLISRTKEKLEAVAKEIEEEFNVEVRIICFDFTKTTGYEEIEKVIGELDIGILVNNVGMINRGMRKPTEEKDIDDMHNAIHCNVFSDVHMTHMVLKGMVARKRGAIIHVSSIAIYMDVPQFSIYPATKVFMEKFFKSLKLEHDRIIDHQLVTPGFVSSNLSQKKPGFACPSAEDYVKTVMRTIGITENTCGYLSHELVLAIYSAIPDSLIQYMIRKRMKRAMDMKNKTS